MIFIVTQDIVAKIIMQDMLMAENNNIFSHASTIVSVLRPGAALICCALTTRVCIASISKRL
jgi:hypothetical protein